MSLESASFITQLVATNPVGASDPKSQGDDHLRLLKAVLQGSFPNIGAAMNASSAELNNQVGVTGLTGTGKTVRDTAPDLVNATNNAVAISSGGSFVGSLSGGTSVPTPTIKYFVSGHHVILLLTGQLASNANSFTLDGLPAALRPVTPQSVAVDAGSVVDGGATVGAGGRSVSADINSGSTIIFRVGGGGNSWATAGLKGFVAVVAVAYHKG